MTFLQFHVLYLVRVTYYPYTAHVRPSVYSRLKRIKAVTAMYSAWNLKDNYDISASVYVVELNGFMSLRC